VKAFLIAGEASGDRLGAALMSGLKQLTEVQFDGVGGPSMQAEGLVSRFPMEELTVFGIAEVLPKYRHLKRRLRETAEAVIAAQPDVLITIDSPDFCLRVARLVKTAGAAVRTVHYVAPSVWAWRAGRAKKMATCIDQVLALLPFEPPYMEAAGMRCDFVGHPVTTEAQASAEDISAFRAAYSLGDAPLLLVLPGSRRGEVARLAPVFGDALRPVLAKHPLTRVVVPAAPMVASAVVDAVRDWPGTPLVLDPRDQARAIAAAEKRAAFAAAETALAASGTVSLELAAAATPMVIAYDMNWLSWQIMSRMLKTDTVTLVNLVSGQKTVEEFLGPACTPEAIAGALLTLIETPSAGAAQRAAMADTMVKLGRGAEPPGLRAAKAVCDGLSAKS